MIIQMEPTERMFTVDGVECRLWNAVTERGSQCFIFVNRIALPRSEQTHPDDQREFDELFLGREPGVYEPKK